MDPDNIPDQSKVACVCPRITSPVCLRGEEPGQEQAASHVNNSNYNTAEVRIGKLTAMKIQNKRK